MSVKKGVTMTECAERHNNKQYFNSDYESMVKSKIPGCVFETSVLAPCSTVSDVLKKFEGR
jgi:hypothetical protein